MGKQSRNKKLKNSENPFQSMAADVLGNNHTLHLKATTLFTNKLASENPPIEEIVQTGVVPRFLEFLKREKSPDLQYEATVALGTIVSRPKYAQIVIDRGGVPNFVELLSSPRDAVREKAAHALANICCASPECRDLVLSKGCLIPLLTLFNEHANPSTFAIATRALLCFFVGKPGPPFDKVKPAIPVLQRLVDSNEEIVSNSAASALLVLFARTGYKTEGGYEADGCPILMKLLRHPSPPIQLCALQTMANFVFLNDMQAQFQEIIQHQALPHLHTLLTNNSEKVIKMAACTTILNITAGKKYQIQAVVEANLIAPLVELSSSADFDLKRHAASVLSNVATRGSIDQLKHLVSEGCVKVFGELITCADKETRDFSYRALGAFWRLGKVEVLRRERLRAGEED